MSRFRFSKPPSLFLLLPALGMAEVAVGALLFLAGAYASEIADWSGVFSLFGLALIYMSLGTFGVAALYLLARVTIWRDHAPKGTPSRHES